MRGEADAEKVRALLRELSRRARGPGSVYLTGGASAALIGWRERTIDVDLKLDPEPAGVFEALARLKDELDLNVELAAPDQFIPALPDWRERSRPIDLPGPIRFGGRAARRIRRHRAEPAALSGAGPRNVSSQAHRVPTGDRAGMRRVPNEWQDLPGADILVDGLEDLRQGFETASALLLRIAAPRLERVGIRVPEASRAQGIDAELLLYRLLRREPGDAYGRYNSSLRRLASLCHALEQRVAASSR
jgi:hypothetical protein